MTFKRRGCALAAMLMLVGAAAADRGAGTREVYLVALTEAPLAAQAAARVRAPELDAEQQRRAVRQEMDSAASLAWLRHLDDARSSVVGLAQQRIGRALTARQVYRYASNGMALELDAGEAAQIAILPGVTAVRRERTLHLSTDAGPQWIGANQLWSGVDGVAPTKGEGVVIGVIDTGINPTHPSFAATGADAFTIVNPRGHFYGLCASGQAQCNGKLIGIYDFTTEGSKGVDTVGHGSHVSGIAAGNAITDALQGYTVSLSRSVSGVAPHANLIMYKGCNAQPIDASSDGTCAESALVGAIDQATADQVDVINYSIGGGTSDPYELLADPTSDAYAFFHARESGIVIAVSAGNEGPGTNTLDEPGNAPWVIGVANASHNRRFVNSLGSFSGAANAPATLAGQGYTSGYGPTNIVYAGNYGNALCGTGNTEGVTPTGASNPFAAGTFHGEIVICDRGVYARVEKGYNVKAAGAGGYILANAASDGESIISDNHFLPAVHLGYNEGQTLKSWVATGGTHNGKIAGVSAVLDPAFGDILDSTSSRGPYGFGGGVLKPDVTAPGDNILSAAQTGNGLALLSGTSMASPHVAGSAALVISAHPNWAPAQVESALIGTALANSVRMQDSTTLASPLDAGSGRIEPALAAQAGLYLKLDSADYFAGSGSLANPTQHGDLAKLNRVGIESESCFAHCSFSRTVTDMSNGGTWQATATATSGAVLKVTPSQFTLGAGASQNLAIALDVSDPHLPGNWVSGRIVLHKVSGGRSATDIALTVAAYATPGAVQAFQQFTANTPGGYIDVPVSGLVELPDATFATTTLAPANVTQMTLGVDTTSSDQVYNPGTGKQFVLLPMLVTSNIPEFPNTVGRVFIVEITASNAVQAVLYAGIDSNNDGTPEASEQACKTSFSGVGPVARCIIDLHEAPVGTQNVWALVDVPQGSPGATYAVTLSGAVPMIPLSATVTASLFNNVPFVVTGPGHVAASTNFPIRLAWGGATTDSQSLILPGNSYGAILIDAASGSQGLAGFVPFSFTRNAGGDDVADALQPGALRMLHYSATQTTLQHVFIDVPAGATSLEVDTSLLIAADAQVSFAAVRADFPPASVSPQVDAAPAATPAASWVLNAITQNKQVVIPVTPGRWYLVSSYASSRADASVQLGAQLAFGAAAAPTLTAGNYFNPQRSGHGIFLSRAAGQQVVDWYTFREDGTPTWYLAQGAAPASTVGAWSADLYRASWNGSSGAPTRVGEVILTATAADRAMFSWHLDGTSGSEAFELIANPACVNVGGNVNLNGEWFPPAQAGYGFDALVLPGQQFDAFYMYDASGNPRWIVGANGPFVASSTIAMLQSTGFCPVCSYQALTTQSAGNMTVTYANGSSGQLDTAITLNTPLSGTWNVTQPIARLTGSSTCTTP
jgi:subtilisin family serine protease